MPLWPRPAPRDRRPSSPPVPPAPRSIGPPPSDPRAPGKRPLRAGALSHFPAEMLKEVPPEDLAPWPFPAFLDNPACPWLQTLRGLYASPLTFPASLSPEAGLLLHAIVRNARPRVVVETGTFLGVSTIWIAAALGGAQGGADAGPGALLHTFDDFGPIEPGPWRTASMRHGRLEAVHAALRQAGVSGSVKVHPGPSAPTLAACRAELVDSGGGPGVHLAFLDADHTVEGVWADFEALEPVLATGGHLVLHDVHPGLCGHEGPRRLVDTINARAVGLYEHIDLYLAPVNYGMAVLRRVG